MGHDDEDPRGRRVVRVTVSGRVQGVGFRAWTERQALMRGVGRAVAPLAIVARLSRK